MRNRETAESDFPSDAHRDAWKELQRLERSGVLAAEEPFSLDDLLYEARQTRKHQSLTQSQVAQSMGTTQSAVSALESGKIDTTLGTLLRYGRAVGLDLVWKQPTAVNGRQTLPQEAQFNPAQLLLDLVIPGNVRGKKDNERGLRVQDFRLADRPWAVKLFDTLVSRKLARKEADSSYVLATDNANIIGLSIHSDRIQGLLLGLDEVKRAEQQVALTDCPSPEDVIGVATRLIVELSKKGKKPILGVGISIAGIVDGSTGVIGDAPALHAKNPLWREVDLTGPLQQALHNELGEWMRVAVENDANALALWEYIDSGVADLACILETGVGVGAGLINAGQLWKGTNCAAGEIGHIIVRPGGPECRAHHHHAGCVETVSTSEGILGELGQPNGSRDHRRSEMERLNQELHLDLTVQNVIRAAGADLRAAVSDVVLLVDPKRVVIYAEPALANNEKYKTAALYRQGFDEASGLTNFRRAEFIPSPQILWRELAEDTRAKAACAAALWHLINNPMEWLPELSDALFIEEARAIEV